MVFDHDEYKGEKLNIELLMLRSELEKSSIIHMHIKLIGADEL
jgi:hypothetical protein